MKPPKPLHPILCAALLGGAVTAAPAAEPLWELGAGGTVLQLPHYRGSDQSHTWLLPLPYVVYRGPVLRADREGARALLWNTQRLDIDLSLAGTPPNRSRDNEARRGMADLPTIVELGPNLNWNVAQGERWRLDLRLPVRAALGLGSEGGFKGWVATPQLRLSLPEARGWRVALSAAAVAQNRRYNEVFYGVPAANAAPGRPAYQPGGGMAGGYLMSTATRRLGPWWLGGFVRWDTLRGASFLDSPLVRQREHWSAGVALTYVFASSSRPGEED
ncbi:MipA/OmpV family protein [Azohydromonas caseinilytica]|uniref:MipA/OmpV family protein n=1 Tax=Azohydromonas caseinilytica TaxID=2728836 RepID=A0A848F6T3_9BURK|nr:MipA/OmpV family protein [Azohydromonas caseinilytica]NML13980.1 MipA/OmpV family protein [Azohydromonas caseinilytica]